MTRKNPFGRGGSIREFFARRRRLRHFLDIDRCIKSLVTDGAGPESSAHARELFRALGDPLDGSTERYIQNCLTEYQASEGSVLITGAGALTLTLGAIGNGDDQRTIWCFDEDPHWTRVLRSWLAQYDINNTFLITTAPALIRNMVRYRIDPRRLPSNFGLVLCEGTRGSVKNPFSVLVHFGHHLSPSFTLLARNVNVEEDAPLLCRWAKRHGAAFKVLDDKEGVVKVSRKANCQGEQRAKISFSGADDSGDPDSNAALVPEFAAGQ